MSMGFSPCHVRLVIFASYPDFFRNLFSRAEKCRKIGGFSP
jgi:hypothetical protein